MSTERLTQISEQTGFDSGQLFQSDAQVRDYFTVAAQRAMFGDDAISDQDVLDDMAADVIANRWHYAQTTTIADAIGAGERNDVLGIREEIELTGRLTDTDDNLVVVVDHWTGEPISREQALAELDAWLADDMA